MRGTNAPPDALARRFWSGVSGDSSACSEICGGAVGRGQTSKCAVSMRLAPSEYWNAYLACALLGLTLYRLISSVSIYLPPAIVATLPRDVTMISTGSDLWIRRFGDSFRCGSPLGAFEFLCGGAGRPHCGRCDRVDDKLRHSGELRQDRRDTHAYARMVANEGINNRRQVLLNVGTP